MREIDTKSQCVFRLKGNKYKPLLYSFYKQKNRKYEKLNNNPIYIYPLTWSTMKPC